ncbi:hypothetical protein LLB_2820 [Legionella longbeachae D-4968]|nr:hypothetical protein LLB_2820 [Legionella longbeachae D-4968]
MLNLREKLTLKHSHAARLPKENFSQVINQILSCEATFVME